jgi:hypothetical protein
MIPTHIQTSPKFQSLSEEEKLTIEYCELVLSQLLQYRQSHQDFYFLTRTNKKRVLLEIGHWFPGQDYLHVGLTSRASGDHATKSVGFKVDCSWGEGEASAYFIILFNETDPAIIRFYQALYERLQPFGMHRESHDFYFLPYGNDILTAVNTFLERDVPIFQSLLKAHGLEEKLGVSKASFAQKLVNVEKIRQGGTKETEIRMARLCWNTNGWIQPSGPAGKTTNKESFEQQYGFGFEEWLLDFDKILDDGYHYRFLQPVNQEWQAYSGHQYDVHLYARNAFDNGRYWIGVLNSVEVIDPSKASWAEQAYQEKGWLQSMAEQMEALGLNPHHLGDDRSSVVGARFNIRFNPSNADIYEYPIPFTPDDEAAIQINRYRFLKVPDNFSTPSQRLKEFNFTSSTPPDTEPITHTRILQTQEVELPWMHRQIQRDLYQHLVDIHGTSNVSWEQATGNGASRIDLATRTNQHNFTYYEIKTYNSLMLCIRAALGQIIEYAYFSDHHRSLTLIIVSQHDPEEKAMDFLSNLRSRFDIPVHYARFNTESKSLELYSEALY